MRWTNVMVVGPLAMAFVAILGLVVAGWVKEETLGYFTFGLLLSSFFVDLAIVASYFAPYGRKLARVAWTTLCLATLILVLFAGHDDQISIEQAAEGKGMILGFIMCVLSFPSGYVFLWMYYALTRLMETGLASTPTQASLDTELLLAWGGMFAFGYLQWFVLFQRFGTWLRNRFLRKCQPGH